MLTIALRFTWLTWLLVFALGVCSLGACGDGWQISPFTQSASTEHSAWQAPFASICLWAHEPFAFDIFVGDPETTVEGEVTSAAGERRHELTTTAMTKTREIKRRPSHGERHVARPMR